MTLPLAERLRPSSIDQVFGQDPTVQILKQSLEQKRPFSMILFGPPGCGKTTLARIYASSFGGRFIELIGMSTAIQEMKKVVEESLKAPLFQERVFLFIDEIHRLTRVQQDFLLPHLEKGVFILIGATTENPSFVLSPALLSRARTLPVVPLDHHALKAILDSYEKKEKKVVLDPAAKDLLIDLCAGDGRFLLNCLESLEGADQPFDRESLSKYLQKKAPLYDKKGEVHYQLISALHKSLRGSDTQASLYWLYRMLRGGEDPLYILRRLIRFASEDIGLADPYALQVVLQSKEAYEALGSPEGDLAIAQATIYLALAPKSNRIYVAEKQVKAWIERDGDLFPPKHLVNPVTKWMEKEGYGKGYQYDPDCPDRLSRQSFLPEGAEEVVCYEPIDSGFEAELKKRISLLKKRRSQS